MHQAGPRWERPLNRRHATARYFVNGQVQANTILCQDHHLLRLELHTTLGPSRPGQFVQLGCRVPDRALNSGEVVGAVHEGDSGYRGRLKQLDLCAPVSLLRRPFSIAGRGCCDGGGPTGSDAGDGRSTASGRTWIDIIHQVVGTGTRWLATLAPGDPVDLIGPLGNGFWLPKTRRIGLLAGGGVGLPPMFYLAEKLSQAGWQAIGLVGARTRQLLPVSFDGDPDRHGAPRPSVREFARFGFPSVVTTDDGSCGLQGRITDGLSCVLENMQPGRRQQVVIFACGPAPMLRAAAELAHRYDVAGQLCVEQAMACGMGTCQSCVVPVVDAADGEGWSYRLACTDGPVFDARSIVW